MDKDRVMPGGKRRAVWIIVVVGITIGLGTKHVVGNQGIKGFKCLIL